MSIKVPATARDVNAGHPFPPTVVYQNDNDMVVGETDRAYNWLGSALSCLGAAVTAITGTFTDGQQLDPNQYPNAVQQIGFAITYVQQGALYALNRAYNVCPVNFNQTLWDQRMLGVKNAINAFIANPGDFNLDGSGHVAKSSSYDALAQARITVGELHAAMDTAGCRTNTPPSGGGSGGDGGGNQIIP